jgi:hypothetical protein
MDWNEIALFKNQALAREWLKKAETARNNGALIEWVAGLQDHKHPELIREQLGTFNKVYHFLFPDGRKCTLRLPVPGLVMSCDEKVIREVTTMRFISSKTSIPVPNIWCWGTSKDNALGLGPFILMDFIEGHRLRDILKARLKSIPGRRASMPDMAITDWEIIYRQIAKVVLELSKHDFQMVGSLVETSHGQFEVEYRPITIKCQEIGSHGGLDVQCKCLNSIP